jgi:hypothetical protein
VALRPTLRNLRCSKISIGRVSAEEHGVVVEARGTVFLSARVSVPRGSAEVIDLHWTIQII